MGLIRMEYLILIKKWILMSGFVQSVYDFSFFIIRKYFTW